MTSTNRRHDHAIGFTRRELIQVGYSALLGLSLPGIIPRKAAARSTAPARAKSVVLVFQTAPRATSIPWTSSPRLLMGSAARSGRSQRRLPAWRSASICPCSRPRPTGLRSSAP